MKIAVVLTVKNEVRLLRNNLLYHQAIGVDQAFVYFDNTTDNGKESIADLDFVQISNSVSVAKYATVPYLKKFTSQAIEHHTARQCLNTYDAQQRCKTLGVAWLISIDADELICTDHKHPSNLKSFFKSVAKDVEVVNFSTLEVLQKKDRYKSVFAEAILFKGNKQAYYKAIDNPFLNLSQKFSWWYGHTMGKAAIRVAKNIIPHNVHRYKRIDGTQPVRVDKGNVLHYHAYDGEDFIKKFTNFEDCPNTFLSGNKVEDLKLLLRDVVNSLDYNQNELHRYFKENLMFHEREIDKIRKGKKYVFFKIKPQPLIEINSVQLTFESIDLQS